MKICAMRKQRAQRASENAGNHRRGGRGASYAEIWPRVVAMMFGEGDVVSPCRGRWYSMAAAHIGKRREIKALAINDGFSGGDV